MFVRYAYAITGVLLAGGTAATLVLQQPLGAQVAQNSPAVLAPVPNNSTPMSFADLAAKLQPAVVNVSTTQKVKVGGGGIQGLPPEFQEFFKRFGGGSGDEGDAFGSTTPQTREATSLGSGFIVSPDGYVVTNNHVITGGGDGSTPVDSITVTLADRKEYKARIVGRDTLSDLAVLKIEAKGLPFVRFGDSTRARVGDWVVAIGNPFGLGGTVTAGIVSALHRSINGGPYDRYIQTDASINQGNSGGPMFDINGNVIGINTAIYSPTGGNVGIGFAIPAEQARPVVETLITGKKIQRGYLGVGIQPLDDSIASSLGLEKNRGEIVAKVEPGQPAARAGVRQGDVIVSVNGQPVTPDNTLSYTVANLPVGARVPIELIRDGKRQTVTAVLGERPSEQQLAASLGNGKDDGDDSGTPAQQSAKTSLGVTLQALTPQVAQQLRVPAGTKGVVIASVDGSSDAAANGLRRGDIILAINQRAVITTADANAAVDAARKAGRPSVLLLVQRGTGAPTYIGVKLGK